MTGQEIIFPGQTCHSRRRVSAGSGSPCKELLSESECMSWSRDLDSRDPSIWLVIEDIELGQLST